MSLSLHQKSGLYHDLGQLARAGRPLPAAIQLLSEETSGAVRRLLRRLKADLERGKTVGEAFASQQPVVSPLEASVIKACDRSGRFEHGCAYLAEYYENLDAARKKVLGMLWYPLFILHAGVFVTGLFSFVFSRDLHAYLKEAIGTLLVIYIYAAAVGIIVWILVKQGQRSAFVDGFLRVLPGIGKLRRSFALARFCATYDMQLESGVNVMDSLQSAGQASNSGLVKTAVARAVPRVRGGEQVGPLFSRSSAFTEDMVRAIRIGEETGGLDKELKRLAESFRKEAADRLDKMAGQLGKGLYIVMVVFIGYRIVMAYTVYINQAIDIIK